MAELLECLHDAVCDSCGCPVIGPRFRCLNCAEYVRDLDPRCARPMLQTRLTAVTQDLCASCEAQRETAIFSGRGDAIHNPQHVFLVIKRPLSDDWPAAIEPQEMPVLLEHADSRQVVHRNVWCDACDAPIVGTRYTCANCTGSVSERRHPKNCTGFDLCEHCERNSLSIHDPQHVFAKIPFVLPEGAHVQQIPLMYGPHQSSALRRDPSDHDLASRDAQQHAPAGPDGQAAHRFSVRRMGLQDLQSIMEIEQQCFAQPYDLQYFVNACADSKRAITVAEPEPGQPVAGYISVHYKGRGALFESLAVHEQARRSGVGRMLVLGAMAEARARGCTKAVLHVSVFNRGAIALYTACGFEPAEWIKDYYQSEREDGNLYVADLRSVQPNA
eukprot:m51a1_g5931 putative ribosomal-protein-alanine acetyltransferase (387) ;mRNA; r:86879-88132